MRHVSLPLALLLALPALAADPPAEPLPKGALVRLGTEKMKGLDGYGATRLHPDGKHLIATQNGRPTLIDLTTGEAKGAFGKATYPPVAVSADGTRAVTATFDGFSVYEVATDKKLYEAKGQTLSNGAYMLSADGKFLACGRRADEKTKKVTLAVYDIDNQKETAVLEVAQNSSATLKLSADGKRGVSWGSHYEQPKPGAEPADPETSPNRLLQFWDIEKEKELANARLSVGYGFTAVAISPDGTTAAGSGGDGAVTLIDTATGKKKKELLGRKGLGYQLAFSPDGSTLAATAGDGAVQLWDAESGKPLGVTTPPVAAEYVSVSGLQFAGPKAAVAFAQIGPAAVAWEIPSGKLLTPMAGHRQGVTGVTFAANDKEVISAASGGEVIRWEVGGKRLADIPLSVPGGKADPSTNRMIVPAAGNLTLRGESGGVGVYDLAAGTQRFVLSNSNGYDPVAGVSADGKTLVMVRNDFGFGTKPKPAKLVVVDLTTNTKTAEHTLPLGSVSGAVLSPDGGTAGVFRTVTAEKGGDSKTVFCGVDVKGGKAGPDVEFKGGYFTPLMTATPDGKGVLTTTPNGTGLSVIGFDGGDAVPLKGYKGYPQVAPAFSKDGKRVAVADSAGATPTVSVLAFDGGAVSHTFRGHVRGVNCLAFSSDGKTLATGSADGTVLLWDVSKE